MKIDKYPKGIVTPPPSKSISHRALICASLAGGTAAVSRIINLGESDDIAATRDAIKTILAGDNTKAINVNESGSTLRFLIPLALDGKEWTFSGAEGLFTRPLGIYEDIIKGHGGVFELSIADNHGSGDSGAGDFGAGDSGADYNYSDDNDADNHGAVLKIKGCLQSGVYEIPGNISSQFISGLLLALPMLDGDSEIKLTTHIESESYVDITISCMKDFGVNIEKNVSNGETIGYRIRGGQSYEETVYIKETGYTVEADYSQAAFFLCAAALGADVKVAGLCENSLQGDKYILEVLRGMGAEITVTEDYIAVHREIEPQNEYDSRHKKAKPQDGCNNEIEQQNEYDSRRKKAKQLKAMTIDVSDIPDLVPPIAALACYAKGTTRLINASRLRMKESDRLAALASELSKIGANIEALHDELIIVGRESLDGGITDSWNDHRIAMALALASIGCQSDVIIKRADAVKKSYPKFWEDFCVAEK